MQVPRNIYLLKQKAMIVLDYLRFNHMASSSPRFENSWTDWNFQIFDKTTNTPYDRHYIYFPAWATRVLKKINPKKHIDISSTLHFCTTLSAYIKTEFYDYRPANLKLTNLVSKHADITKLPFKSNSIESISCMHVLEHIGLGRYGDPIDPDGDLKGAEELVRVTKKGGTILIVVPVGKQVIEFNAHRIYSHNGLIRMFQGCKLKQSYLIPLSDQLDPIINASPRQFNRETYGCGCFWFIKE